MPWAHWRMPVSRGLAVFLVAFVLINTIFRSQFDLSYNDSIDVVACLPHLQRDGLSVSNWSAFIPAEVEPGSRPNALRPLQRIWANTAATVYSRSGIVLPTLAVSILLGLSAWWMYRLFAHFGDERLAAVAAGAFVTVPSVLSPSWIPINGPQALIPGLFALALGTYLEWQRSARRRQLVILGACCFIGPLFKESLSLMAWLIVAHHLVYAPRRSMGFAALMALLGLHGFFPSFVPALVLFGKVHVLSIFQQGALHDHLAPKTYRHVLFADLQALFPPSLLCVVLGAIAMAGRRMTPPVAVFGTSAGGQALANGLRHLLSALALAALALKVIELVADQALFDRFLPEMVIATLVLYALLYVDTLLAGWAIVIIGPLSYVYFNVTQCCYAVAPLIYCAVHVTGWAVGQTSTCVNERRGLLLRRGLATIICLAVADNGLSLVNATLAYSALADFNAQVAAAVQQQLPARQPPVPYLHLSNTVASDDSFVLHSHLKQGRGRYTFNFGVPPSCVVDDPADLVPLSEVRDLVLVKAAYVPSHKEYFWELDSVAGLFTEPVRVRCRFVSLFADPLRLRCDNRYRSVLCPPDYQDEFTRQRKFLHEKMSNEFEISVCRRGGVTLAALQKATQAAQQTAHVENGAATR